jgi:hypothetical protein
VHARSLHEIEELKHALADPLHFVARNQGVPMTTRTTLTAILFCSLTLAACAGGPTYTGNGGDDDSDGAADNGNGHGDGNGDGDGDGGGDDGDTGGPTGGSGSVDEAYSAIAAFECAQAFACQAQWDEASFGDSFENVWGADEATCTQEGESFYDAASIDQGIANGTILFDAAAAAECISALQAAAAPSCDTFWDTGPAYPDACNAMITGTVAENGACTSDYECADLSMYCGEADTCVTD